MSIGSLALTRLPGPRQRLRCTLCQAGLTFNSDDDPHDLLVFIDEHDHRLAADVSPPAVALTPPS